MVKLICDVCKKEFFRRQRSNKYCSKECYYQKKKDRGDKVKWTEEMRAKMSLKYKGDGNPNYGNPRGVKGYKKPSMSGEKHFNWKGGYSISPDGYKVFENVYTGGKRETEHRLVVEKHIGRKLLSYEIVHHMDGNKINNDIRNLVIVTRAEHINIHRNDIKKSSS
jgi:hypothetical protein